MKSISSASSRTCGTSRSLPAPRPSANWHRRNTASVKPARTAMTHCAEMAPRLAVLPSLRWLAPLLAIGLVAGCASSGGRPATKPAPVVEDSEATPDTAAPTKTAKGDPDARFTAALKLLKDRQMKEARDAFFQLAKDFPQYGGPYTDLAIIQYQAKQPALAIANFEKAARLNPDNAIAWNWLGVIARENKDYPRAEAAYKKALEVKPDYAAAHLNLGVLNDLYTRRPAEALNHYREYQRLAGGDKLIVTAWIKELEAQLPPQTTAPAATGATP
eukprot:TRINITY_DN13847_c0_g1_i4.p1 TRINITY_DN13847_c0_g1~~TRINITY_DN13847_c0_g1_i4.p1  ORF type:complete len:274 (+),score=51.14 TRINITY_DN13847_c0_g1_i4:180-1001(+)